MVNNTPIFLKPTHFPSSVLKLLWPSACRKESQGHSWPSAQIQISPYHTLFWSPMEWMHRAMRRALKETIRVVKSRSNTEVRSKMHAPSCQSMLVRRCCPWHVTAVARDEEKRGILHYMKIVSALNSQTSSCSLAVALCNTYVFACRRGGNGNPESLSAPILVCHCMSMIILSVLKHVGMTRTIDFFLAINRQHVFAFLFV